MPSTLSSSKYIPSFLTLRNGEANIFSRILSAIERQYLFDVLEMNDYHYKSYSDSKKIVVTKASQNDEEFIEGLIKLLYSSKLGVIYMPGAKRDGRVQLIRRPNFLSYNTVQNPELESILEQIREKKQGGIANIFDHDDIRIFYASSKTIINRFLEDENTKGVKYLKSNGFCFVEIDDWHYYPLIKEDIGVNDKTFHCVEQRVFPF